MYVIFVILAAVIMVVGGLLSTSGRASLAGSIVVGVVFLLVPVLMHLSIARMQKRAERFVAGDGTTLFAVGPDSLRVADVVIPYDRITCLLANPALEEYSNGGVRGEVMAARLGLTEDRPTFGRAIGSRVGTKQRRRLYRDGAKSGIELVIGVDRKAEIDAPEGAINALRTLPHRGDDPGRIDVPFGAYLTITDLEDLLAAVYRASGGQRFPIGIVTGTMNWATATTAPAETREVIWQEAEKALAAN